MSVKKWILSLIIASASVPVVAVAGNYTIDPDHTYPSLEFPHIGLSIWRGKFNRTSGSLTLDLAARKGSIEVKVDAASIDFGHDEMNEHALKPEWLDTKQFPTMTYKGVLRFKGDTPVAVDGQLTLRGVTKPLTLKINSLKCMVHPFYKKEACGADAGGELNRADFGMAQYTEGGMGIIHLRIQVEALKEKKHGPRAP